MFLHYINNVIKLYTDSAKKKEDLFTLQLFCFTLIMSPVIIYERPCLPFTLG